MTDQEAREILDEIRTERPRFVRPRFGGGFWLYQVSRDGQTVDVYRMPKSKKRAVFERTATADAIWLPAEVRARLAPSA